MVHHDCDGAIAQQLSDQLKVAPGEAPVLAIGRWMGMPYDPGFREREQAYLEEEEAVTMRLLNTACRGEPPDQHVLDTTGSVVHLSQPLRDAIRSRSYVVYLATSAQGQEVLLERYLRAPKPVVWGGGFSQGATESTEEALARCYRKLLAARDTLYRDLAHHVLSEAEVAEFQGTAANFLKALHGSGDNR